MRPLIVSSALVLASPIAHAAEVYRFAPGVRAHRIAHEDVQDALRGGREFRDFLTRRGPNWTARFDEATGRPVRLYGEGLPVPARVLADEAALVAFARDFLRAERLLLGLDARDLEAGSVARRGDIITVPFRQTHLGLAVEDARISVRFAHGRLVMAQMESMPGISVPGRAAVPRADALETAMREGGFRSPEVTGDGSLVVLPRLSERSVRYALAWRFEIREAGRGLPSAKTVFVDASGGGLLEWRERVRFAAGTVIGELDDRYPEAGTADYALMFAELDGSGGAVADGQGDFTIAGAAPLDLTMQVGSEHFNIQSLTGGGLSTFTSSLTQDGGDVRFAVDPSGTSGAQERGRAELDAHRAAHIARERSLSIWPQFPYADDRVTVRVNDDQATCNAWFDENAALNFMRQGGGCNNTARVWDVVIHEYGHGFHAYAMIPGVGQWGDGATSEGFADYLAATITGDHGMARGFFQGSTQPLRDVAPNLAWPDDIDQDPHITGLITAGALWDLRTLLADALGDAAGIAHADYLFWQAAARSADTPDVYDEVLLADDDNGNLADGTPNRCLIDEAFGPHGLGPGAGGTSSAVWSIGFEPLRPGLGADQPLPIEIDVALANPECASGTIDAVRVRYTTGDGNSPAAWDTLDLTANASGTWGGELPEQADGSYLRYIVEVIDDGGELVRQLPAGSVTDPWFAAWVGDVDILWESDFEADDAGFTHELIDGPDQEGADDWQWGAPGGLGGDPGETASGDQAWGNDLALLSNWNGEYQPDIHSVLRSGPLPADGDGPVYLQMRRWLQVEDGFYDRAWVEVNGETVWENRASSNGDVADVHHHDFHWAFRSFDVTDLVDSGQIEVEWHLETDGGLQFGGWNIDDVRVITPVTAEPTPGDDDDDDTASTGDDDDDTLAPGQFAGSGGGCSCEGGGTMAIGLLLAPLMSLRRRRSPD